eukprot:TRINITY_DN5670_c0_g1_i1.p1 TRINITY_DN5670_c0_g1~~TRINITY_DN5670_c0_g1_i1.p1  ORF type:complete len:310 (-),score=108.40 TRINITY_DN5670_c0_g1_i1:65-925(-)
MPVRDLITGKKTEDTIKLDSSVFGANVRPDIMHRVVVWKLACKRSGMASVKTRGEVKGSRKKLAPQKGRGRARVGDAASPIRRGGGKAHGKRPRDFSYSLPKRIRRLGFQSALSAKFAQKKLIIVKDLQLEEHKTNILSKKIRKYGWKDAVLIHDYSEEALNLRIAAENIPNFYAIGRKSVSVYDILRSDKLIISLSSLQYLTDRVHGNLPRPVKVPMVHKKKLKRSVMRSLKPYLRSYYNFPATTTPATEEEVEFAVSGSGLEEEEEGIDAEGGALGLEEKERVA